MLENRLDPREIEQLAAQLDPEDILVLPYYHDLENDLKQPDRVRIQTDYFWRYWAPELGPTLTALVIALRSHCYYNRITKEKRDWCFPRQETLGKEIGVSRKTVMRALRDPLAEHFIRREKRYRYDQTAKQTLRSADLYHVAMDDPIHPDHHGRINLLAAERILREAAQKTAEKQDHERKSQIGIYTPNPVENPERKSQIGPYNAGANWDSITNTSKRDLSNVNVLEEKLHRTTKDPENAELLAKDLADQFNDQESLGLYRTVARQLPDDQIFRALSETKDASRRGQIRTTQGQFFTDLVKRYAQELGYDLQLASGSTDPEPSL